MFFMERVYNFYSTYRWDYKEIRWRGVLVAFTGDDNENQLYFPLRGSSVLKVNTLFLNEYIFYALSFPLDITNSCKPCYYTSYFLSLKNKKQRVCIFSFLSESDNAIKLVMRERKGKLNAMLSNKPKRLLAQYYSCTRLSGK